MKRGTLWVCLLAVLFILQTLYLPPAVRAQSSPLIPADTETASIFLAASEKAAEEDDPYADDDMEFLEEIEDEPGITVADPLYGFNVIWFHFNDKLYFWLLKPAAQGYKAITPQFFRTGVRNFFYNIRMPIRFVNSVLQGKIDRGAQEFWRFCVNSTFGAAGLFNIVKDNPGLNPPAESTAQTLGVWGFGNGFYLTWPIFGPSTFRDTFGLVGDMALDPMTWILWNQDWYIKYGVPAYEKVNEFTFRIGEYESLKEMAVDPYQAIRDAYVSNMQKKINE